MEAGHKVPLPDLSLDENTLIRDGSLAQSVPCLVAGKHVLVAYTMKPKAGHDFLATAAHFAAACSTATNVNMCTTGDFTKPVDAVVYYIDPNNEVRKIIISVSLDCMPSMMLCEVFCYIVTSSYDEVTKIAHRCLLFDGSADGPGMLCSFLERSSVKASFCGNFDQWIRMLVGSQRVSPVAFEFVCFAFEAWAMWSAARSMTSTCLPRSSTSTMDLPSTWRRCGASWAVARAKAAIKPKNLQPKPSGEACYSCWQGEEFMNMDVAAANECRLYVDSLSVEAKPRKMIARGKYVLSQFGQRSCATALTELGLPSSTPRCPMSVLPATWAPQAWARWRATRGRMKRRMAVRDGRAASRRPSSRAA